MGLETPTIQIIGMILVLWPGFLNGSRLRLRSSDPLRNPG